MNDQDTMWQIAAHLGLERPGLFVPPEHARARNRALGLTTTMILWALVDVVRGKRVQFMAPTKEKAADIVYKAREYARRLGADPKLVLRPVPYGMISNPRYWPRGARVFKDHGMSFSGGPVHEPQETFSRGAVDGYHATCPWCRRTIPDVCPRRAPLAQGGQYLLDCPDCGGHVRVHVEKVRVVMKAWRDDPV